MTLSTVPVPQNEDTLSAEPSTLTDEKNEDFTKWARRYLYGIDSKKISAQEENESS